jgi:hypothetical protein
MDEDTNFPHTRPDDEDEEHEAPEDTGDESSEQVNEDEPESDDEKEETGERIDLDEVEEEVREVDEAVISALADDIPQDDQTDTEDQDEDGEDDGEDDPEEIPGDADEGEDEEKESEAPGSIPEMAAPDSSDEIELQLKEITELLGDAQDALEEVSEIRETVSRFNVIETAEKSDLSDYRKQMIEWRRQGYNTARLEPILEIGISDLAQRTFEGFERDIGRLAEIERSINSLDTTGFKKKEADIRENLKDPDELIRTLKHLIELEIEIRRKMEMDI